MELSDIDRLKLLISDAESSGESKLPPEPRLSEKLGITRGRLRTLLKQVESEGLIWRHVGKGTFVGRREDLSGEPLPLDSISADQVIQARLALEPQLAALAAIHATPSDISALEQCIKKMRDASAFEHAFEHWKLGDEALHYAVATATHNPLLIQLYKMLKYHVASHLNQRVAIVFGDWSENESQTEKEHYAFVQAIKRHDPEEAERLMTDHIRSVRARLFGGR